MLSEGSRPSEKETVVVFLLVLAVVLFLLGIFTAKILWWAALILAILWLVGVVRPGRRTLH